MKCIYTNADVFRNKFEEFKLRYITTNPDVILVTEVLPQNFRYAVVKAEYSIPGYDIFPEGFPIEDTRGILVYVKKCLNAVEINKA